MTRPDFDGIVCAVLLSDALDVTEPIKWVEPNAMQHGNVEILPGDIIANLSFNENCSLWFDHHESNRISRPYNGVFKIAPSAAGIIYEHFKKDTSNPKPFQRDYHTLVEETDKIDSANLSLDEVLNPDKHPYIALSSTVKSHNSADEAYWNRVVHLLRTCDIFRVLEEPDVKERVKAAIEADQVYKRFLETYTGVDRHVSITDYRSLDKYPSGNRFLVFSLFPDTGVDLPV
ncbi:MAG: exopolyphosphatase, partial [bacterium]|nr:exopolyphosphatase [bacterium]